MPVVRLRRLRRKGFIRDWAGQTQLNSKDFILPYFVIDGKGVKKEILSMPGVYHLSLDNLIRDAEEAIQSGIRSILLFGIPIPKYRDKSGFYAYNNKGIVQKAIKALKKRFKDLIVITDVCLCGYTSHGHCGVVSKGGVDNDATLKVLSKIALSHAGMGADFVAPSAMMDGQVKAIRGSLDKNGFNETGILAYSAKYASNFYGPFREAFMSRPEFGDRKTYQMDFRNSDEALREIKQDIDEGADIVMVKPAMSYLDIIYRAKEKFHIPIAGYNVSGEYSMLKAYIKSMDKSKEEEKYIVLEALTGIKRAGADFIITYYAKEAVKWLR